MESSSFSLLFPFSWVADWNLGVAPRRTGASLGAGVDKGAETSERTFSDFLKVEGAEEDASKNSSSSDNLAKICCLLASSQTSKR